MVMALRGAFGFALGTVLAKKLPVPPAGLMAPQS